MGEITALRYIEAEEDNGLEEIDTLLAVEITDPDARRGIDLHVGPRTVDVVTVSVSAEEAWRLARELARAAALLESGSEKGGP